MQKVKNDCVEKKRKNYPEKSGLTWPKGRDFLKSIKKCQLQKTFPLRQGQKEKKRDKKTREMPRKTARTKALTQRKKGTAGGRTKEAEKKRKGKNGRTIPRRNGKDSKKKACRGDLKQSGSSGGARRVGPGGTETE